MDETVEQGTESKAQSEELSRQKEATLTVTCTEIPDGEAKKPDGLPFEFEQKIGEGAFGVVWLAKDRAGQEVAVKIVRTSSRVNRDSFQTELTRLRSVSEHPNVVTLLDAQVEGENPYLTTLFYEAGSLAGTKVTDVMTITSWLRQTA